MQNTPYAPLRIALRADTIRFCGRFSLTLVVKSFLMKRNYRPVATLRLCQWAHSAPQRRFVLPLFKLLHRWTQHAAGMDLPWNTVIGPGFCINHGWGIVVSPEARIGSNVTLFHGVTLGRRDRMARDGTRITEYPLVEDQVCIGPHAIVVGGVIIGEGSRIAGGAFVTESVPARSVVGGNPASILKSNTVPDVMNPAPLAPAATGGDGVAPR
jgi:serine O-acetyltransferase